jgi:hypothetical protein
MSMKIISSGLDTNVRRVILVLAALVVASGLALGLGLTREAQAVGPPTEPIRQSLLVDFDLDDEACSGDLIHLTGKLNSVFHLVDDGAGGFHVNTEFNFADVQGTGAPSGGHYRVPTTARSTFYSHSDGFPIIVTETTTSTVIGQGQLPDSTAHLLIHFTIHENDTVTAEVIHFRSECK